MAARGWEGPRHGSLGVWSRRRNTMIMIGGHSNRSLLAHIDILKLSQGSCDWVCRLGFLNWRRWSLSIGIWRCDGQNVLANAKSQACIGIDWLWAGGPFFQQIPSLRLTVAVGLRSAYRTCRCLRLRRVPGVSVARLCITGGGSSLQIFGALASKRAVVLEKTTLLFEHLFIRA